MTPASIVRACVLGLAAGDALSWVAADHRERLLPERRVWMLRFLDGYADETRSTTRPRPHVHSSPTAALRPGPGDDLEWFTFSAQAQLRESRGEEGGVRAAWLELAGGPVEHLRARTGTLHALGNLRAGLRPPQSGHDNPHYFDDIACVRAVAAGLLAFHDDAEAAARAQVDAEVTHSLDGVWCARAMAVLIAELARGVEVGAAIEASVDQLPPGTWSRRHADFAVAAARQASSSLDLAMRLDTDLTDKIYSYAVAAPETLALLLGHVAYATTADELMLGAFGHGRNADALPALAGAVAGLRFGADWIPRQLMDGPIEFDGVCIPQLAGTQLEETVRALQMVAVATA